MLFAIVVETSGRVAATSRRLAKIAPGSPSIAGARGQSWLKIKKAHMLDMVILGAEWGSGRRKGWLSNL